jgi:hypothetical protein
MSLVKLVPLVLIEKMIPLPFAPPLIVVPYSVPSDVSNNAALPASPFAPLKSNSRENELPSVFTL